jgi:signal transduction histidine kinase
MAAMTRAPRVTALARNVRTALRNARPAASVVDATLAVVFLAAMFVERATAASEIGARMPVAIALSVIIAGALALRRRAPLTAYLVGSAALSVEALFVLASPVSPYANLIGVYSLGLYATRGRALLGPVIVLLGTVAYFAGLDSSSAAEPVSVLFLWLLAWALGYSGARRQEERDAARRLMRQRVVADERARIARELHDLVGHTLNVMLVQAGAARRVVDRDPDQTRDLLSGLEHTGREALDELDRVLGLLRRSGPASAAAPDGTPGSAPAGAPIDEPILQPGLADLARLTERMGQAGIRITVHIDPAARQLPRTIDVSAYRIVQEALTNTVKHGRADSAGVTVRRDGHVLDIEVRDDGRGVVNGYTPGRGLLGIDERVSMFGGSVEHGGGERGGFRLHAVLPIP